MRDNAIKRCEFTTCLPFSICDEIFYCHRSILEKYSLSIIICYFIRRNKSLQGVDMPTSQLNGLEYLTAIKNGEIPSSAMSEIIPMRLILVRENYVEYEVRPDQRHYNLQGGIHGGFCATVLDSA